MRIGTAEDRRYLPIVDLRLAWAPRVPYSLSV